MLGKWNSPTVRMMLWCLDVRVKVQLSGFDCVGNFSQLKLQLTISRLSLSLEVSLFIDRLMADWDRQPLGMKQSWQTKTALPVHAACGGYLAIMKKLESSVPQSDFQAAQKQAFQQFQVGLLDLDINPFLGELRAACQPERRDFCEDCIQNDYFMWLCYTLLCCAWCSSRCPCSFFYNLILSLLSFSCPGTPSPKWKPGTSARLRSGNECWLRGST